MASTHTVFQERRGKPGPSVMTLTRLFLQVSFHNQPNIYWASGARKRSWGKRSGKLLFRTSPTPNILEKTWYRIWDEHIGMNLERAYGSEVPLKVLSRDVSRSCQHFRWIPRGEMWEWGRGCERGDREWLRRQSNAGSFLSTSERHSLALVLLAGVDGSILCFVFPFCMGKLHYPVQLKLASWGDGTAGGREEKEMQKGRRRRIWFTDSY